MNTATGVVTTLYQDGTVAAYSASFAGDGIQVRAGPNLLQFQLNGTPFTGPPPVSCLQPRGSAEISGRTYEGVRCGTFSPDLRWMLYDLPNGETTLPSGRRVALSDAWLLDLQAGTTRMVQAGLRDCGGCDGRHGPRWSPSGRYVAFAELGGDQRLFLADVTAGVSTRVIANGADLTDAPQWSPARDLLLFHSRSTGRTFIEELPAQTVREIALAWPVAFDLTGRLAYSPAWAPGPKETGLSTIVVDVASGDVVATLPGAPAGYVPYTVSNAVAATTEGVVAALQGAIGCSGTAIYLNGTLRQCVADGVHGEVGGHGVVAVARKTGSVGPAQGPGFHLASIDRFDIDVISASGQRQTIVRNALSPQDLTMSWNASGTHLLVLWPGGAGFK